MNVLRSNRQKQQEQVSSLQNDVKNHRDINFYLDVPSNLELSVDDFESLALARLKILRKIEEFKTRNLKKVEYTSQLDSILNTNFKSAVPSLGIEKSDVASHFILRAAYSRSEDLRRWFLTYETSLFRHRLEKVQAATTTRGSVLKKMLSRCSDLDFEEVDKVEKERLRDKLLRVPIERDNVLLSPTEYQSTPYFKMPFVHALELVKHRHVYLESGNAYVPMPRLLSILTAQFRSHLSRSLVQTSNVFNNSEGGGNTAEKRISPLLHNMNQQHTGKHYGLTDTTQDENGIVLTAQNIDSLASSMPLCMRQIHNGLKRDHKLKYNARLQYILFLKGAGMTMEETVLFLQHEFTKIMSMENFTKQYSYSVRHLHGKEGKRASKAAYSCTKIILGQPPQGGNEHHGCPFKHYDTNHLSNLLSDLNMNDRDAILDLNHQKNHQLACQKHFEVSHPNVRNGGLNVNLDGVGNHPNAWFHASVGYKNAMEEKLSGGNFSNGMMDASPSLVSAS